MEPIQIGFTVKLNTSYAEAIQRATDALKSEGFGVLTSIDVKETLKQKIGADFRRYIILGACNPALAHRALSADLDVSLLLPCNVIVYEDKSQSVVSIVDPKAMLGILANPALEAVAEEARVKLRRVAQALSEHSLATARMAGR
jgi:uncharacterized protein (DUF302 family)